MSTPKWTPPPWRPYEGGPSHMVIASNEKTVANLSCMEKGRDGGVRPAAHCVQDIDERTANSHLIAAAPELYAEVELLRHIAMSMPDPKLGEWDWPLILVRTSLLLAKARREATS